MELRAVGLASRGPAAPVTVGLVVQGPAAPVIQDPRARKIAMGLEPRTIRALQGQTAILAPGVIVGLKVPVRALPGRKVLTNLPAKQPVPPILGQQATVDHRVAASHLKAPEIRALLRMVVLDHRMVVARLKIRAIRAIPVLAKVLGHRTAVDLPETRATQVILGQAGVQNRKAVRIHLGILETPVTQLQVQVLALERKADKALLLDPRAAIVHQEPKGTERQEVLDHQAHQARELRNQTILIQQLLSW